MGRCEQYEVQAQLYFDGELKGQESEHFGLHLLRCRACQEYLQRATELSEILRSSRPLFSASDELINKVAKELVEQSGPPSNSSAVLNLNIVRWLRRAMRDIKHSAPIWRGVAIASVFGIVAVTLVSAFTWHVSAASYADAALQQHQSYLAGNLPPEILSSSPDAVTGWFAGKVPFKFRLPASQPSVGGQQAYRLVGARLVQYKNNYAALVIYEMKASQISLMVTSDRVASAAGGDEVRLGGLTFHYHSKNEMNVITWSTHGLTYALVSPIYGSARGSCLVCHQNMTDQNKFKDKQEAHLR